TYSDTVAKDEVISVDLSVDTDKFTRGTSLKINISKGPAPAGTIKVENFKGQAYSIVENWAKTKKITLKKVEAYDDDMASGLIISQSIAADKEMKEGETLTVTVSKGKGVTVPNFLKMSETEYNTWKDTNTGENAIQVKEKVYYSDSASYVLKQSVTAGTTIAQSEVVIVTINKGDGFYLNEALTALGYDYVEGSTSYDRLDDWSYKAKEIGLNAQVHMYTGNYVASDKPKGTILKIEYAKDEDGNKYSMNEKLPLDVRIFCSVSSGELDKDEYKITADDLSTLGNNNLSYDEVKSWVDNKSAYGFGIEVEYGAPITSESRYTIKGFEYKDSYGNTVLNTNKAEGTVIPYGSVMVISQNGYTPSSGSSGSGSGGTSAAADE
ncbi:MAG: PASTA domain-containing protein, partial [Solobacterium sp.]|nr:PASTA domain-containing protein [Solobacterium sp.]